MKVNFLDGKNGLSSLIVAAERDEEMMIAHNGVPVVKIVKYSAPKVSSPGVWNGKVAYFRNGIRLKPIPKCEVCIQMQATIPKMLRYFFPSLLVESKKALLRVFSNSFALT